MRTAEPHFPHISILVPTCGRAKLLEHCLEALCRQQTTRQFEIIVIDNAPQLAQIDESIRTCFQIRLITEARQGLSYARNAGILAALGEIIVFTDDDTRATPHWLENLVAPFFQRAEVMAVTGRTLPFKLENEAERLFESYGGLCCRRQTHEFGSEWLKLQKWRLPLWQIGTTANAAFRAAVFRDPAIGLLDERLGAGSPVGAWEDLYLFYRILRAGYDIVYRPKAKLYHLHRQSLTELSSQLQAYRRGEVAFCLLSLKHDREWRSILHLLFWIPYWRTTQLIGELLRRLCGRKRFNLRIVMQEWYAYLKGPAALLASHHRAQRWSCAGTDSGKDSPLSS